MTSTQSDAGTPQPGSAAKPSDTQPVQPNQYHLQGGGISVSYFPEGFGPVQGGGVSRFTYQDAHQSLTFNGDEIRTVDVPDLGTLVSVSLVRTTDTGFTSFSLLLPHVVLPARVGATAPIETQGITTIHRAFVAMIGHAQSQVYTVTALHGTGVHAILPW